MKLSGGPGRLPEKIRNLLRTFEMPNKPLGEVPGQTSN